MNNLSPASGVYEFTSRALYAEQNKLPTAEELLALEVQAQVSYLVQVIYSSVLMFSVKCTIQLLLILLRLLRMIGTACPSLLLSDNGFFTLPINIKIWNILQWHVYTARSSQGYMKT